MTDLVTLTPAAGDRGERDDDWALLAAVRDGDDDAFARLYERYRRRIAAYAFRFVRDHARAEDITQDVFLSALRRMRATTGPIVVQPWLYEIARNACIDQHRRTSHVEEVSYEDGWDGTSMAAGEPGPAAVVDTKARLDDLCHAFRGLSRREHQLLILRDVEGLSYREIGERLQLNRSTVQRDLGRARTKLIDEYDELSSGARCRRVQSLITAVVESAHAVGRLERLRIGSHVLHCGSCRLQARRAGLRVDSRTLPRRLAALLPLPAWLRRGSHGSSSATLTHAAGHVDTLAPMLGGGADWPAWTAATAAVATVGLAFGVGAVVAQHPASPHHVPARAGRLAPARGGAVLPLALLPLNRGTATVDGPPRPVVMSRHSRVPIASALRLPASSGRSAPSVSGAANGETRPAAATPRSADPTSPAAALPSDASRTTATSGTHATLAPAVSNAGKAVSGAGSGAAKALGGAPSTVTGAVGSAGTAVGNGVSTAATRAGSTVTNAGSAVPAAGAAAGGAVTNTTSGLAGAIQGATSASPLTEPAGQAVSHTVTGLGSAADGTVSSAVRTAGAATGAAGGVVSHTGQAAGGLVKSIIG